MQLLNTLEDGSLVNEREIRAAAGILFVPMLIGLMIILLKGDFLMIKFYIILFHLDLWIRVIAGPQYAPSIIIGRSIVARQAPEYVAVRQKIFAWKIGIGLSGLMFILIDLLNSYSIFTGLSCLFCLIFLFFETAFGICLGCWMYGKIYRGKLENCPGGICDEKVEGVIKKISVQQLLIVVAFIVVAILLVILLNSTFSAQPRSLWKI